MTYVSIFMFVPLVGWLVDEAPQDEGGKGLLRNLCLSLPGRELAVARGRYYTLIYIHTITFKINYFLVYSAVLCTGKR